MARVILPSPSRGSRKTQSSRGTGDTTIAATNKVLGQRLIDAMHGDIYGRPFNVAELRCLGLESSELDLDTQQTEFLRPVPRTQMSIWIEEVAPEKDKGPGIYDPDGCAFLAAENLCAQLTGYIRIMDDFFYSKTLYDSIFMQILDQWSIFSSCGRGHLEGGKKDSYNGKFWLKPICRPRDVRKPHIASILVCSSDLQEDTLDRIELLCIVNLTGSRMAEPAYDNHLIPVKLITIADFKCRVIIAHFDARQNCVFLQKSRIMTFKEEGHHFTEDWKRALCWILAEPIGNMSIEDKAA